MNAGHPLRPTPIIRPQVSIFTVKRPAVSSKSLVRIVASIVQSPLVGKVAPSTTQWPGPATCGFSVSLGIFGVEAVTRSSLVAV